MDGLDFGKTLQSERKRKGLTLADVAAGLGLSHNAIWKLEQSDGLTKTYDRIADFIKIEWVGPGTVVAPTFGARIRRAREKRQWSVEKLAKKSGLSKDAVTELEADKGHVLTLQAAAAVLVPGLRAAKPKVSQGTRQSTDVRFTSPKFLDALVRCVGRPIDLDPCANPVAFVEARTKFYIEDDGLSKPWAGHDFVFVNPPFSAGDRWLHHAYREFQKGGIQTIVCLLPSRWTGGWHEVLPHVDCFLLRHRIKFYTQDGVESEFFAPFQVALIVFGGSAEMVEAIWYEWESIHIPKGVIRKPDRARLRRQS